MDLKHDLDVPGTERLIDVDHSLNTAHAAGGKSDIVLLPPPTQSARDPLTWSNSKKYYQLGLLALYACAFSYGENTLGAAWTTVSEETDVSLTNMNGGSALNYLLLGIFNIVWIPAAMKIGRRPIFLMTLVIIMTSSCWGANYYGTASYMLQNAYGGIGVAAYEAVIQLGVFDMFYAHNRGRAISIYIFGQQLGSILGLISGGSIADNLGWRWSQWIEAIITAGVLLLFLFTFEETLFPRFLYMKTITALPTTEDKADSDEKEPTTTSTPEEMTGPDLPARTYLQKLKPWVYFPEDKTTYWMYFRRPFVLFRLPNVVVAGFIFAFGNTAGIVSFNTISEILTDPPYNFSTTATGLVFFAALVGNIVGWATGVLSDYVVLYLARRNNGIKEPEMRLWVLCLSFIYATVGYFTYGWQSQTGGPWIGVAVGIAFMIAHQVSATTIATTYAMECFPGISGELVVVLAICTSCINFAISYSVQPFISATNYGWAFTFFGICVMCSMIAAIPTFIWGKAMRKKAAPRWREWLAQREDQ